MLRKILLLVLVSVLSFSSQLTAQAEGEGPAPSPEKPSGACELIVGQGGDAGDALTVFLLMEGGTHFEALELPTEPPSQEQVGKIQGTLERSQQECIEDFSNWPVIGTGEQNRAQQFLAYMQRIDPEKSTLLVGLNQLNDPQRFFSGVARTFEVDMALLADWNSVEDVNNPGDGPFFHPHKSIKLVVDFIDLQTTANLPREEEGIAQTDLLPLLNLPEDASIRSFLKNPGEDGRTDDDDKVVDTTTGPETTEGTASSPKSSVWDRPFLLVLAGALLGLILTAALGELVTRRSHKRFQKSLDLQASIRELAALFPGLDVKSEEECRTFLISLGGTLQELVGGLRTVADRHDLTASQYFANPERESEADLDTLKKYLGEVISGLEENIEEARGKGVGQALAMLPTFQEDQNPQFKSEDSPGTLLNYFRDVDAKYKEYRSRASKLAEQEEQANAAKKRIGELNSLFLGLDGRVLDEVRKAEGGGGPARLGEEGPDFSADPGQGQALNVSLVAQRQTAYFEWLKQVRGSLANLMKLKASSSWEEIRGQGRSWKAATEKEEAFRLEMARQLRTMGMDTKACLGLVATAPTFEVGSSADTESLRSSVRLISDQLADLRKHLKIQEEGRSLQKLWQQGTAGINLLQEAITAARSQGQANILFEVLEQEVPNINRYLNWLNGAIPAGGLTLKAASDQLFISERETRDLPSVLQVLACLRTLRSYEQVWGQQLVDVRESLEAAEPSLEKMLNLIGLRVHGIKPLRGAAEVDRQQVRLALTSKVLEDRVFQEEIGRLYRAGKIQAESTILEIEQLGFEVEGASAHKAPWQTRIYIPKERTLRKL